MFSWSDRSSKVEVKHYVGTGVEGELPRQAVYDIGKYQVTVSGFAEGAEVFVRIPGYGRGASTDPRSTLPNMEIVDGEIRIPIEDLVEQVLARATPLEVAEALWSDADVRSAFMDKLVSHYSSGMTDAERRGFLRDVQTDVHSVALDAVSSKIADAEHVFSRKVEHIYFVHAFNTFLRDHDVRRHDGEPLQYRLPDLGFSTEITARGKVTTWEEARSHWRAEALKVFPPPE